LKIDGYIAVGKCMEFMTDHSIVHSSLIESIAIQLPSSATSTVVADIAKDFPANP